MKNENLQGIYAPVEDESDFEQLEVRGELPDELRGSFLRNGPNPAYEPLGAYHLFDGDGMVHALHFDERGVRYRNRWVKSEGLGFERAAGRALFGGMTHPVRPDPEFVPAGSHGKNPANTNIIRHAGTLLCLWEGGPPTRLDADLDTLGSYRFDGRLLGNMTAHPRIDPVSGELHFFGYSAFPPYLRYHVVDAKGEYLRCVELDLPRAVMMHDFLISERYAVFFDCPAIFDFEGFRDGGNLVRFAPEHGTRIGILPRDAEARDVRWFETDPCYVFHFLNAWDEGSKVHITGSRIPYLKMGLPNDGSEGKETDGMLTEFTVDLEAGTVGHQQFFELPSDFCRVADSRTSLRNRFGYTATADEGELEGGFFDALAKHDFEERRSLHYRFGREKVVGEAVFAEKPGAGREDEGWLLAYLYDLPTDTSEVVVLDATAVEEGPVARIVLPRRVPFGFHGNWLPAGP